MTEMNSFDIAAYKKQLEAELREKIRAEVQEEFVTRAEHLVTAAQIAKELNSVQGTVENVITGANIQYVIKHGRTKFYDPADIKKAYTEKHKHLLAFLGLVHVAPENDAVAVSENLN